MLFSETRHNGPGRRIFDVRLEGKVVAKDLDVFKMAKRMGKFYRLEREVTVDDGVLDVGFTKVKDETVLTAIAVENVGKLKWTHADEAWVSLADFTNGTASTGTPSGPKIAIIKPNAEWAYLVGSDPKAALWRSVAYDGKAWLRGPAGFGYGDNDDRTNLNLRGKHLRVYIRAAFEGQRVVDAAELGLMIRYDDGFIAYLNGKEVARSNVGKGSGPQASGIGRREPEKHKYFVFADFKANIRPGPNVIAIEGHNTHLGSSDFSLDPYLVKRLPAAP